MPCRPVFRLLSGNSSVTPTVVCHAMSPVFAFTAIRRLQGGFWQGHVSPTTGLPSGPLTFAAKRCPGPGPDSLPRSYCSVLVSFRPASW